MELRRRVRGLQRRQRTEIPMEFGPITVGMFYLVGLEELNRERMQLNNAERLYRDTYPNLVERINIQARNGEVQEDFIDDNFLNAVMEGSRLIQQLGEQLLRQFREVPFNAEEVPPNPPVPPLENGRIHRPPPAIRQFPVAEAQEDPDDAPGLREAQEFVERVLEMERLGRLARRRAAEMNAAPAGFIQVIHVENRQNQDEPRQEDQEGLENGNPEEPRQDEGPENQGRPENQPDIQEVQLNPIEIARNLTAVEPQSARVNRRRRREEMEMQHQEMGPLNHDELHEGPPAIRRFPEAEAHRNQDINPRQSEEQENRRIWNRLQRFLVVDGLGPEERGVVVPREAQPRELLPHDRWIELQRNRPRPEPRPEDQEGPENGNPEEPRQDEGSENQGGPENRPEIILVVRRPAVAAPEAPVVEGPAPEEQREVGGPDGPREAQSGEHPERRVEDDGVPHPQNQDEPRQEDLEGSENQNRDEPPQEEGPENQEDPANQPQN
ncbi:unnamed protein product [Caenorhabditis nigoni]